MTIPEHSSIERRIQKAYSRMSKAKGEWAARWADAYKSNDSAKKAMDAVATVRRSVNAR
jgi:hypothetical protein